MSGTQVCATCSTAKASLLRCGRCKSVSYCDKACQKAHWKIHKKGCAPTSQDGGQSSSGAQAEQLSPAQERDKKPFTAISNNKFLHDRSEEETFKLLIDMLRMRQEDEYVLAGDFMVGTIYNGAQSSESAFLKLIRKAKIVPGILPPWWGDESTLKCLTYARKSADFSLRSAQEKHDIQETWGDKLMPMKLRMVSERVYGYTPGGTKSDEMLAIRVGIESGEGEHANLRPFTIDHAALGRGEGANACTPQ